MLSNPVLGISVPLSPRLRNKIKCINPDLESTGEEGCVTDYA
jgi:hypothetical protein